VNASVSTRFGAGTASDAFEHFLVGLVLALRQYNLGGRLETGTVQRVTDGRELDGFTFCIYRNP
jgi:hypothetical protein